MIHWTLIHILYEYGVHKFFILSKYVWTLINREKNHITAFAPVYDVGKHNMYLIATAQDKA